MAQHKVHNLKFVIDSTKVPGKGDWFGVQWLLLDEWVIASCCKCFSIGPAFRAEECTLSQCSSVGARVVVPSEASIIADGPTGQSVPPVGGPDCNDDSDATGSPP